MKGAVRLPVFIDDARKYVNTTQLRAKYLGASYEAEYCQWQTLHGLGSLMETASLIITPNTYLEGKLIASYPPDPIGDFDVTRATTATRVNSAGLVELVPYNLLSYSQDFANNSVWTSYNSTISSNTTTAPDGTTTADSIVLTSGYGSRYQSFTFSSSLATISVYFKKVDFAEVYIDAGGTGAYFGASFNLDTQVSTLFGVASSAVVESVGNGWYRCSVVAVADGTKNLAYGIYGGVGGQSVYVWGAQVNLGTIQPYQKTETRLNIPRLDYSNGTCPSLLVEPQRTNVCLYSNDLSGWIDQTTNTTKTRIQTGGPDGNAFDRLVTTGSGYVGRYVQSSSQVGNNTCFTTYLRGSGTIQLGVFNMGTTYSVSVNLTNEWVRYENIITNGTNGTYMDFGIYLFGGVQVDVACSQVERANYPTSYIPTTSASVTRNADVISKTGISSLIGQTEGTMFWEGQGNTQSVGDDLWIFGTFVNDSSVAVLLYYVHSIGYVNCYINNGSSFVILDAPMTITDNNKVAIGYKNGDFVMYLNGVAVASSTSAIAPPSGMNQVAMNKWQGATGVQKQQMKAAALWKTRLTNTQLAQLTTI